MIYIAFIGMSEQALKIANEALKYIPDYASIYFNIANILGKVGRFSEAETYFKQAILRNPTDPMFYTNLGIFFSILYISNNTIVHSIYYVLISIKSTKLCIFVGVLYHRWNKVSEAEYMYKKALEFNPHSRSAKENLKKLQSLKRSVK